MTRTCAFSSCAVALVAMSALTAGCPCDGAWVHVDDVAGATVLAVCAAVADTEAQRRAGLRERARLAADDGLLLVFPTEGEVCIVNDGVAFAIDAVFAREDGEVVDVHALAAEGEDAQCVVETRRVLEVAQGVAVDVVPGDRLVVEGGAG